MKHKRIWIGFVIVVVIGIIVFFSKQELLNGYFSTVKLQFLVNYLEDNYLYDVDEDTGVEGIYSGYMNALNNSATYYLDKNALKSAKISEKGNYFGVGLTLMWSNDERYLIVVGVEAGSPADQAGIKNGDCIMEVGDVKTSSSNSNEIVKLIYSEPSNNVAYKVRRGEENFTVYLTPEEIILNDFKAQTIEDVLYVKVRTIKAGTSQKLESLLSQTDFTNCKGLILDLRSLATNNIEEVRKISDLFLDEGVAFKVQTKKSGVVAYNTEDGAFDVPVVLITNAETIGGAEALVLALQERATIVGSNTGGNPYTKRIVTFDDGTGVSVAEGIISNRYGEQLSSDGVEPNDRLYIDEEEKVAMLEKGQVLQEEDSYLQSALSKFQ